MLCDFVGFMPKARCEQLCPVPVPRIPSGNVQDKAAWWLDSFSLFLILHLPPQLGGARECPGYHRLLWPEDRTHLVAAGLMFSWDRAVPKGQRQEINPCPMEAGRMIPLLSSDSSLRQAGQGSCELLLRSPHSGTVPFLSQEGRVAVLGYFPMVTSSTPTCLTPLPGS